MIDKVLQLEKEDKNQAALQASHRAPVGSQVNAAAKGKDGKGTGEKKKGKGKNKGGKGGGKDRSESPSGSSGNSTPRGDRPPSGEVPCKFLFLFGNCSKGNDCSFAHRVPSAAGITKYGFKKSSSSRTRRSPASHRGKESANTVPNASSHMTPRCLHARKLPSPRRRRRQRANPVEKGPPPRRTANDKLRRPALGPSPVLRVWPCRATEPPLASLVHATSHLATYSNTI